MQSVTQDASWFVHPELSTPDNKRTSPRQGVVQFNTSGQPDMQTPQSEEGPKGEATTSPINILPAVGEMMGASINNGHQAVNLQYKDKAGQWHQLDMSLGDAMYLLSILKAMQLNLDIPFPDDPRDPTSKPVRPSERGNHATSTSGSAIDR
jgi:hypothetical protein